MPPSRPDDAPGRDDLQRYRDKRDPGRTTEPFGRAPQNNASTLRGRFVVHLHAATRTHFDLRIQIGGVLKSFAVPRGPSLDPADKRLAINTEDHPIGYLDFEDVIPAGNYGAGAMIMWDEGTIVYLEGSAEEGLARAKLDFLLHGHKLRGRFALVHTGARHPPNHKERQHWLLLKKSDAFAQPAGGEVIHKLPYSVLSSLSVERLAQRDNFAAELIAAAAAAGGTLGQVPILEMTPMLCASRGANLDDADRLYELKLDGVRILAARQGREALLRYRRQRDASASYPEIARALAALPLDVVLDGEIVAYDERGRPNFERLGQRIAARGAYDVQQAAAQVAVQYMVFDVLQIGPYQLLKVPLAARKELLALLLPGVGRMRRLDHLEADGRPLMTLCDEHDLEGLVAKRKSSSYQPGPRRSEDWVKLKRQRDGDFVVVGWEQGRGSRVLGALLLASYRGSELILRGKAGSGLTEDSEEGLLKQLRELEVAEPAASGELDQRGERHWVTPELVVSVRYSGLSGSGTLRHPVYRGLAPDRRPSDCVLASAEELAETALEQAAAPPQANSEEGSLAAKLARRAKLTNQHKLFWPSHGYTKGDLCDYYASVSEQLLPYLRGRPIVMVRYPDGIEGKQFYQWNVPRGTPSWLRSLSLRDEDSDKGRAKGKGKATFLIDDLDGLLYIANLGCIPIHILAARENSLDQCDFMTVDLDIGERPFRDAVTLAHSLREILTSIGLSGFAKTSGRSGMHVLIPLGPGVGFSTAHVLVELLGRLLQARHDDIATMERRLDKRGGRVYIDTVQTGRSRTIVAPYSLRAIAGARVSTPLHWDEVHQALDPAQLTIRSVPARLAALTDPMAELLHVRPDVPAAAAALEAIMTGQPDAQRR